MRLYGKVLTISSLTCLLQDTLLGLLNHQSFEPCVINERAPSCRIAVLKIRTSLTTGKMPLTGGNGLQHSKSEITTKEPRFRNRIEFSMGEMPSFRSGDPEGACLRSPRRNAPPARSGQLRSTSVILPDYARNYIN